MQLPTQSFDQLLSNAAVAVQASSENNLNLDPGSVLRAFLESGASQALWLQLLIWNVLLTTRLATSGGTDVDSFAADFGLARLSPIASTGQVTFFTSDTTRQVTIPLTTTVNTNDNTLTFQVIADTLNPNYNVAQGVYILPAGVASINITVQCTTTGSIGNVGAGTIGLLSSAIPFIQSVNNLVTFVNGVDQESDNAFKKRFAAFFSTLARGTLAAIGYSITTVEPNLTYSIEENVDTTGAPFFGHLIVTVDDGTGNPSSTLLSAVSDAVNAYRAATVSFNVFPPQIVNVNVVFTLTPATGYTFGGLTGPIANAVEDYINTLSVGQSLYYSRLMQVIYDSTDGIANISALTLNGGTADIGISVTQVAKTSSVVID